MSKPAESSESTEIRGKDIHGNVSHVIACKTAAPDHATLDRRPGTKQTPVKNSPGGASQQVKLAKK